MQLIIGKEYHGFVLIKHEELTEIQAAGYEFEHAITKAKLVAIKNKDANKFFGICFKTIPSDSTGVPHILEHAVLSGSKKYPLKELFGELIKTGLKTFINAMTYAERTCYPFASKNKKEYFQTMDVYLDVVFNPLLAENTFLREGWHLDYNSAENKLFYNGIVFNEMKGAFSDPYSRLSFEINRNLLPNSTYAVESGGLPLAIPDLTYKEFKAFHAKYYHPSNSVTVVYGDADILEELEKVNSFFQQFTYQDVQANIILGNPITKPTFKECEYPIGSGEEIAEKTWHSIVSVVGSPLEIEKNYGMGILSAILHDSSASPLKKKLLEAGICKEVMGDFDFQNIAHTCLNTTIKSSEKKYANQFYSLYNTIFKEISQTGIEKDLIEAEVASYLSSVKEHNAASMRGFNYMRKIFSLFTYGNADLFAYFKTRSIIDNIAEKAIKGNLLEELIETHVLNNNKTLIQTMLPSQQLGDVEEKQFNSKLEKIQADLSIQQVAEIAKNAEKLKEEMESANTPEALQCLPMITKADVDVNVNFIEAKTSEIEGVTIIESEVYTGGLIYVQVGFNVKDLPAKSLEQLMSFTSLLREVGTSSRSSDQLVTDLTKYTNGLGVNLRPITSAKNSDLCLPMLWFTARILPQNIKVALELLSDIFTNSHFTNQNKVQEILSRDYSSMQTDVMSEGRGLASAALRSMLSSTGAFVGQINGIAAYQALKQNTQNCLHGFTTVAESFNTIKQSLFVKENMLINIGGEKAELSLIKQELPSLLSKFNGSKSNILFTSTSVRKISNLAYINNADVVYAMQGINLSKHTVLTKAVNSIVATLLDTDLLYNKIRILGGAYGAFLSFDRYAGDVILSSYRDPNVAKTYAVYETIPQFLRGVDLTNSALEQLLINSYGEQTPLLDPLMEVVRACDRYLAGITEADVKIRLADIFTITVKDIRAQADIWEQALQTTRRAIIGNKAKIMQDKELFSEIVELE